MWFISIGAACIFNQDYVKKIEDIFGGRDGSKLQQMKSKDFAVATNKLYENMREKLNKSSGPGLLKDYSPWMHTFQANTYTETIEVPGQYLVYCHMNSLGQEHAT